jgi:hypothetical protein
MSEEMERLRASSPLHLLLTHYAAAGDLETWQDRMMRLEGVSAAELTQLHGELLANDWIEQNTGVFSSPPAGIAARCYRPTRAGLRALKHSAACAAEEEDLAAAA